MVTEHIGMFYSCALVTATCLLQSGEIICAPARHSPNKAAYQIWSL